MTEKLSYLTNNAYRNNYRLAFMYLLSNSCRPEGELVNKWKEKGLQGTRVFYARERHYTFGSVIPEFLPKNEYQHWVELNLQTSSRICCFQFLNSRYIWEWRNNPTGISWVGKVRKLRKFWLWTAQMVIIPIFLLHLKEKKWN